MGSTHLDTSSFQVSGFRFLPSAWNYPKEPCLSFPSQRNLRKPGTQTNGGPRAWSSSFQDQEGVMVSSLDSRAAVSFHCRGCPWSCRVQLLSPMHASSSLSLQLRCTPPKLPSQCHVCSLQSVTHHSRTQAPPEGPGGGSLSLPSPTLLSAPSYGRRPLSFPPSAGAGNHFRDLLAVLWTTTQFLNCISFSFGGFN